MKNILIFALSALLFTCPALAADSHVSVRLAAAKYAIAPGETVDLAIVQDIADGWHTYWKNPGDSGEPMDVTWQTSQGVTVGGLRWPAPVRVPYADLMNFGYEHQAIVLSDVRIPADFKADSLTLQAKTTTLVCNDICIPEDHEISLTLPVRTGGKEAESKLFKDARAAQPTAVNWNTKTEVAGDKVTVTIVPDKNAAINAQDVVLFPETPGFLDNAAKQTVTIKDGVLSVTTDRDTTGDPESRDDLAYVLRVGDTAYALPVHGATVGDAAPVAASQDTADDAGDTEDETPAYPVLLVFAFIGGMILNLMPCVFPILSMKALHLSALKTKERIHAVRSGVFYTFGVVCSFLVIGAVFLALRNTASAALDFGWGYQLQNPVIITVLAWLMFAVGMMLSGVFGIHLPVPRILMHGNDDTAIGAFATGILATIVATPCTGPFMATAVGATLVLSSTKALLIFGFLGFGLAVPYLLLAVVPALQRLLPRPGAWMTSFRHLLAFPMYATAVWLAWVAAQQMGADILLPLLGGMVLIAFIAWLKGRFAPFLRIACLGVLVVMALFAARPHDEEGWKPYSPETLAEALSTDQPVFVNMTAAWCITCMANERVALNRDETRELFMNYAVITVKGDWTKRSPQITDYLRQFDRVGVPLYVYYPAPQDGERPDPVVLPQILTPSVIRDAIDHAEGGASEETENENRAED